MEITEKIKALKSDQSVFLGHVNYLGAGRCEIVSDEMLPTDDLKSLATLIEQQSAVIEEAEKALGEYDYCDTCGFDRDKHDRNPHCDNFQSIAGDALARIQQIRGEAK